MTYKIIGLLISSLICIQLQAGTLKGLIIDSDNEPLIGADVLWLKADKIQKGTVTDINGQYTLDGIESGEQTILVRYTGYKNITQTINIVQELETIDFKLENSLIDFNTVEVIGYAPNSVKRTPGSATKLSTEFIQLTNPIGTQEALSTVPGIYGFADDGMNNSRINIGIRGLNPRRSSRILVLEDGIPIQPAIYIYPNMYYNPPVERLDAIEVIKGSGAIKFGPQTMGGVINYVTKRPSKTKGGALRISGGNNGLASVLAQYGGFGNEKIHPELQVLYKRGDGYRDNNHFDQFNTTFKVNILPTSKKSLYIKANINYEQSNATYTGLTDYSFRTNPTFNPKENDEFEVARYALDVIYTKEIKSNLIEKTKGYLTHFDRRWWRENDIFVLASLYENRGYQPGDEIPASDYANTAQILTKDILRVGNGVDNFGILRTFTTAGVEKTYSWTHNIGSASANLTAGARGHFERFIDEYKFGNSITDRTGSYTKEQEILNDGALDTITLLGKATNYETVALSIFLEEKIEIGALSITPGVRVEAFEQTSVDRLRSSIYKDKFTYAILPGIGFNYEGKQYNIYGGLHRGFTPPSSGTLTVLDFGNDSSAEFDLLPEKSWNTEFGIRGNNEYLDYDVSLFHIYVQDLVAAGRNTVFSNLGEAQTMGLELSANFKLSNLTKAAFLPDLFVNYTYLKTDIISALIEPTSVSPPDATTAGFVDISGNELPYAPAHSLSIGARKKFKFGLQIQIDAQYVSEAFTDFENAMSAVPAGNQGVTDDYLLLNANINYTINKNWMVFANGKNLLDTVYIGSRLHSSPAKSDAVGSSGILVGPRRQVNLGVKWLF